jgi:hypothetical protein
MRCCSIALFLLSTIVSAAPVFISVPFVAEPAAEQAANLERNRKRLQRLQAAARQCVGMRLVLSESQHARIRRPVELSRLNDAEMNQMRDVIFRLRPVKTAPSGDYAPQYVVSLQLEGAGGQLLDSVDYMDAAPEGMVSPDGYAPGSRFVLDAHGSVAWHLLMKADYARSIAKNPAPTRLRQGMPKFNVASASSSDESESASAFPEQEPQYYHKNCKDSHKGHKHKRSNHYCDHPQKK